MDGISIIPVTRENLPLLETALRQLASDLGDVYVADRSALEAAVCGPQASCLALIALQHGTPVGAVLATQVFSTTRGGSGMFVSDLWVAESSRGRQLARRLLARTLHEAERRNDGCFLKLTVYDDNPGARAAYDRLGFVAQTDETNMFLTGAPLKKLKGTE